MEEYPLYTESAFSLTPLGTRVTLYPGETYYGSIKVSNPIDAKNDLRYKISVVPYSEIVADGSISLSDYSGITDWVKIEEKEGVISPNEVRVVNYSVEVPQDAAGGGQYFALLVQNVVDDNNNSSGVLDIKDSIELSSVVFAQVEGEIIYDGTVTETYIPTFSFTDQMTVRIAIENTGNVHQDALVKIEAREHYSGKTVPIREVGEVNKATETDDGVISNSFIVLPNTAKDVELQVAGMTDVGVYDFYETVYYNNTEYTADQTTIMCPLWLIGASLFAFLALVAMVVLIIRKWRKKHTVVF